MQCEPPTPQIRQLTAVGLAYDILLSGVDTDGAAALLRVEERPGLEPPPHIHQREHQAFYVLEGEVKHVAGGREFRARPGDFVFLPRGLAHSFEVQSDVAHSLMLLTPPGFENYFQELTVLGECPPTEVVMAFRLEVSERYGFRVTWLSDAPETGLRPFMRRAPNGENGSHTLASREETGGEFSVHEVVVAEGASCAIHDSAEAWYILEGSAEFWKGRAHSLATAGQCEFLPRGDARVVRASQGGFRALVLRAYGA